MRNSSIILIWSLVALMSCTKSKEVHPELGDGNEEFITVAATTAHVEYTRTDLAELRKVVFHYGLSGAQQFTIAEMAKKEDFFDLTLNDLVNDTLYQYYYELFPSNGETSITEQKTFHTLAVDSPVPPTPPVVELPAVVTIEVSGITANSAVCGGEVTNDGGAEVTERGICWSINANPTIADNHVTAGSGVGAFTASLDGLEANTTYHVRAYATNEAGIAYGQDVEFTTLQGGGSGDHEYVDLGLPSGTLWATCNVGANVPEECGDYFAWGETQPKNYYDWNTYRYCNGYLDQLTKYCSNSSYGYNGFTDTLTVLLPEDDAATANWGSGWCTPTEAQWMELYQNTTNIWTTQNGVNGGLFTSANGATLFLPTAGWRWDDGLDGVGLYGCYWSSSLGTGYPYNASYFYFGSGYYTMTASNRDRGQSVRPVRTAPQN